MYITYMLYTDELLKQQKYLNDGQFTNAFLTECLFLLGIMKQDGFLPN